VTVVLGARPPQRALTEVLQLQLVKVVAMQEPLVVVETVRTHPVTQAPCLPQPVLEAQVGKEYFFIKKRSCPKKQLNEIGLIYRVAKQIPLFNDGLPIYFMVPKTDWLNIEN
jgi:hypothetical protein